MIKYGNEIKKKIDPAIRIQLIRKGNQLFTEGNINLAEKIFITTDYKDGLVRLGDYYFKNNDVYKSAQMYFMSENKQKINTFCKKMALVIEKYLNDDKNNKFDKIISEK